MKTNNFHNLLHKSGFKATPSRLAVLAIMQKSRKPMSAQNVVREINGTMDQATVYRIFKDLKSKGILRQVDLHHNHAHYELVDVSDHHHLICIHCGRIEDVNDCGIEEMQGSILRRTKHFSEIKQHSLEFYGICRSCSKKQI